MTNDEILIELVAKGVSGETIAKIVRAMTEVERFRAEVEILDRQRAAARERMRSVRERSRTVLNSSEQAPALSLEKKIIKEEKRKSRPTKTSLPDDWQPKGPQRDPTEAEEFRNKARAKGWTYVSWDAGYLNYQKHPDYNHRNKPGWQAPSAAVIPINETPAQTHARIEALRLEIVKQVEEKRVKAAQATRVWQDTGLGPHGLGDAAELRPARGVLSGENPSGQSPPLSAAPWKNGSGGGHG
jgi:hypothetical protein